MTSLVRPSTTDLDSDVGDMQFKPPIKVPEQLDE